METLVLMFHLIAADDRMACWAEPMGRSWHYRSGVEGRAVRCWYDGPAMKPREQLFWPVPKETPKEVPPELLPADDPRPPWLMAPRFYGEQ